MAQIDHPQTGDSIEVDIVDRESYHGTDVVQIEATDDDVTLTDESGDQPWVEAEEVTDA